jgi:hypothetical protein
MFYKILYFAVCRSATKTINITQAFVAVIIFRNKMPTHASNWAANVSFHTISGSEFTTDLTFRHYVLGTVTFLNTPYMNINVSTRMFPFSKTSLSLSLSFICLIPHNTFSPSDDRTLCNLYAHILCM